MSEKEELIYEEDTQKGRYLTFKLDRETFGIEILYVIEIIGIQTITLIPEMPEYIKGIINLRGKIIPLMDVRIRFKKEEKDYNDRTCIIVVNINEISLGLIVDSVAEVLSISEENTVDPPQLNRGYSNHYIKKIGKVGEDVKLLLDCNKLITEGLIDEINNAI